VAVAVAVVLPRPTVQVPVVLEELPLVAAAVAEQVTITTVVLVVLPVEHPSLVVQEVPVVLGLFLPITVVLAVEQA
jgi:hypothetical protein